MLKNSRSIAIILELENLEEGMEQRVQTNLLELQKQIAEIYEILPRPVTLKVVFDSKVYSADQANSFIQAAGLDRNPMITAQAIGEPNIHYYQHKDVGAAHCDDDIIICLDSDLLIEPGWLSSMAHAFDGDVDLVCGRTLIETDGFMAKVYALTTSGFPVETSQPSGLHPTKRIMANALAYRRMSIAQPIFPVLDAYRGHCALASRRLIAEGQTIYCNPAAVARHPSEPDFGSYFSRAFSEGRDCVVHARFEARAGWRGVMERTLPGSLFRLARAFWGHSKRTVTQYRRVGMPLWGVPATLVLGWVYYSVSFAGEIASLANDRVARRLSLVKVAN